MYLLVQLFVTDAVPVTVIQIKETTYKLVLNIDIFVKYVSRIPESFTGHMYNYFVVFGK